MLGAATAGTSVNQTTALYDPSFGGNYFSNSPSWASGSLSDLVDSNDHLAPVDFSKLTFTAQ
jgi:hypothetical protein